MKTDLAALMTTARVCRQNWVTRRSVYPHAWHSAAAIAPLTVRGAGGHRFASAFAPTNSWPTTPNLDKARRLVVRRSKQEIR